MKSIQNMSERGTISKNDMDLVMFTDDFDEGMAHIHKYITTNYKIVPRKRKWWLFEKI
mgnify:FL=1